MAYSWPPRPAAVSLARPAAAGSSPSSPWPPASSLARPPASAAAGHFASGLAPGFPSAVPAPTLGTKQALVRVPKGTVPKGPKGGGKGHRISPYERRIGVKDEAPTTPPEEEPEDAGDPHGVQQLEDHILEMHCHGVA